MERESRKAVEKEGFEWGPETIEARFGNRFGGLIEAIVGEELEATLGASRSQRVGAARTGYRHGMRERQLSTSLGKTTIWLAPRAVETRRRRGKRMAQPDHPSLSTAHRARGRGAA